MANERAGDGDVSITRGLSYLWALGCYCAWALVVVGLTGFALLVLAELVATAMPNTKHLRF